MKVPEGTGQPMGGSGSHGAADDIGCMAARRIWRPEPADYISAAPKRPRHGPAASGRCLTAAVQRRARPPRPAQILASSSRPAATILTAAGMLGNAQHQVLEGGRGAMSRCILAVVVLLVAFAGQQVSAQTVVHALPRECASRHVKRLSIDDGCQVLSQRPNIGRHDTSELHMEHLV